MMLVSIFVEGTTDVELYKTFFVKCFINLSFWRVKKNKIL